MFSSRLSWVDDPVPIYNKKESKYNENISGKKALLCRCNYEEDEDVEEEEEMGGEL